MTEGYNREEEYFHAKDQELLEALIHQTVWVIQWNTESGDKGMHGAWFHHPNEKEQSEFMKTTHPDDFDAQTIHWECVEFKIKERIGD